jgi:hypothetical protein
VTTATGVDLDLLLRCRVIVARYGEKDLARWWSSELLGATGASALRRGFPRTHSFAQARAVFAVATARCEERYTESGIAMSGIVTLWHLPADVEEEFEARWEWWLGDSEHWRGFFEAIIDPAGKDLVTLLMEHEVVGAADLAAFDELVRPAGDHFLPLAVPFTGTQAEIGLLALGFARGSEGDLVVPYARARA